mgnify:FL=1|tara:strand:- start:520 stop:780 length:261 start_codon:yes stop_codon:yes gene_type:complete
MSSSSSDISSSTIEDVSSEAVPFDANSPYAETVRGLKREREGIQDGTSTSFLTTYAFFSPKQKYTILSPKLTIQTIKKNNFLIPSF